MSEKTFLHIVEGLLIVFGLQPVLWPPGNTRAGLTARLQSGRRGNAMAIEVGLSAEVEEVVTEKLTAHALGNTGVMVYATPFVVCLMENAAQAAIRPHLPPGAGTVGTTVEMKHLAATPLGMTARAKATVIETDGKRCLFQVDVFDDVEKIAEGRHERFIVPNLEKFLARAMGKKKP